MRRSTAIAGAAGCLSVGVAIYLLLRPSTLLMFQWCDFLGLRNSLEASRLFLAPLARHTPKWITYSLPFALWVSAYLLSINVIWSHRESRGRRFWFWIVPILALSTEIGQISNFVPGTFDPIDFLAIVVAVLAVEIADIRWSTPKFQNHGLPF